MILEALCLFISANVPVIVVGSPGLAKSALVTFVANLFARLIECRVPLYESYETKGLPSILNGETVWSAPGFWPTTGRAVLLLEEMLSGFPETMVSLFQVVWDRAIGQTKLSPDLRIVATSNRLDDGSVVHEPPSPMRSRMAWLEVKFDRTGFLAYARGEEAAKPDPAWAKRAVDYTYGPQGPTNAKRSPIHRIVRGWVAFADEGSVFTFDAANIPEHGTYCVPRSLELLSRLLYCIDAIGLPPSLAVNPEPLWEAVIGAKAVRGAMGFGAYFRLFSHLPDVEAILKGETVEPPESVAARFATITALAYRADSTNAPNVLRWVDKHCDTPQCGFLIAELQKRERGGKIPPVWRSDEAFRAIVLNHPGCMGI